MNASIAQSEMISGVRKPHVWLVVVSKPFQERQAKRQLEQQAEWFGEEFEVYLPQKLSQNRKKELIASPFFPRYLFVRVDLRMDAWKRIWSTFGVHGLLGATSGRPYGVADWVVERLRQQEDAGYIRMGLEEDALPEPELSSGDAVRVAGSPLEAVFLERVDDKRALILVSLLGRDSRATVDIAKLKSAAT